MGDFSDSKISLFTTMILKIRPSISNPSMTLFPGLRLGSLVLPPQS